MATLKQKKHVVPVKIEKKGSGSGGMKPFTREEMGLVREKQMGDFNAALDGVGYGGPRTIKDVMAALVVRKEFPPLRTPEEAALVESASKVCWERKHQ